jgi:hypothetical protein
MANDPWQAAHDKLNDNYRRDPESAPSAFYFEIKELIEKYKRQPVRPKATPMSAGFHMEGRDQEVMSSQDECCYGCMSRDSLSLARVNGVLVPVCESCLKIPPSGRAF